ncbi:MAG: chemotaxis protein CheB [Candidatus Aureabacteria bacterium]|nr:chemotaxis protein CheB [Candidatus Auribacterota bacterium]
MSKLPVLLIEDLFSVKKRFLQLFSEDQNLILIGTACSELMARKMLQSFLPSLILCHEQFINTDFLKMLSPFFAGGEISLVIYGKSIDHAPIVDKIQRHLKVRFTAYLWLNPEEDTSYRDFYLSFLELIASRLRIGINKPPMISQPPPLSGKNILATKVIAIGSSAGGPRILNAILSKFSPDLDAAVLLVQHITEPFTEALADSLKKTSSLKMEIARDKLPILKGHVYLAPGGFHLEAEPVKPFTNEGQCVLNKNKMVNNLRPSVDNLMLSLPSVYGKKIVGMILTGMGKDGVNGMCAIKSAGGRTLVQDEETSMIFGMPKAVIETGCVDKILPFTKLPAEAEELIAKM